MNDKKIIYKDLKLSNILIYLDRLDKCLIKLSNINKSNSYSINGNSYIMAPEVLKDEKKIINSKSNIWSLGIIIYYMLFKEYPYNGKVEYQILKEIESNKQLKFSNDDKLNDLLSKMLKVEVNER